jgi:cell division protein FtsL
MSAPVAVNHRRNVLGALAAVLPALPRPAENGDERPSLRVVEKARRERRRHIGTVACVVLFAALFAVAGSQAYLVQQQRHIDSTNIKISRAEDDAELLRVELAQLQSPQRITQDAAAKLGMIPAPTPVYLEPRATDDQYAAEEPPLPTPPTTIAKVKTPTTAPTAKSTTPTTAATAGR